MNDLLQTLLRFRFEDERDMPVKARFVERECLISGYEFSKFLSKNLSKDIYFPFFSSSSFLIVHTNDEIPTNLSGFFKFFNL